MFDGSQFQGPGPTPDWNLWRLRAGEGWLYYAWGPAGPVGLGWVPDPAGQVPVDLAPFAGGGPVRLEPAGSYGRFVPLAGDAINLADAVHALLSLAPGTVEEEP